MSQFFLYLCLVFCFFAAGALAQTPTSPVMNRPPVMSSQIVVAPLNPNDPNDEEVCARSPDSALIMSTDRESWIRIQVVGHPTDSMKAFAKGYLNGCD